MNDDSQENEAVRVELLKIIPPDTGHPDSDFERRKQKIIEFADQFRAQNPDWNKYELYHLLIGSVAAPENKVLFDTDDHQIEGFIRSLE